ncbi:MAG: hypothetical protein ACOC42_01925 [Halobacteriota archaeon]
MRDPRSTSGGPRRRDLRGGPRGVIDRALNRARGEAVGLCRTHITRPLARHLPFGLFRRFHRLRRRMLPWRYTDADPFAIRYVDPDRIRRSILEYAPRHPQYGLVVGGSWDQRYDDFEATPVFRAIEARFVDGVSWDETGLYDCFIEQLDRFGNAWGYTTPAGFSARCDELDRLFDAMQSDGFRRQEELSGDRWSRAPLPRLDEINVDIGHDGIILWRAYGQHRLAMAKVLDIEAVPVIVQRRHRSWQHIRDILDEHGPSAVRDRLVAPDPHPDLQDLLVDREA